MGEKNILHMKSRCIAFKNVGINHLKPFFFYKYGENCLYTKIQVEHALELSISVLNLDLRV